ncbi:MAG: hypothetical protein L7F78_15175 [Syntrophales bacterium LBB04]|nr:hypothetical protein [Syntrophales bacterium LBB04]
MTDQERREDRCKVCGKPVNGVIPPGDGGEVLCRQCSIERAEQFIRETPVERPGLQRLRETRSWRIMMIIFFILIVGIIAYQSPKLLASFKDPKPARMGTYETDENTDRCIRNLWQQAYLMQQGRPAAARGLVCPVTGKPYVIIPGSNPGVRCPNPERHGFRDIAITKKNPVPELQR